MKTSPIQIALLILLLASCRPDTEPKGGGGVEPGMETASPVQVTHTPKVETVRLPLPLIFNPPDAEPRLTPLPVDVLAHTLTPTSAPPFILCSPLVDTPIGDLSQIVSEPYRPPPPGREERHHGVDFAYYHRYARDSIEGAQIQSVLAGQVAAALDNRFPYGNAVMIETPATWLPADLAADIQITSEQSLYILFAHLHDPPGVTLNERLEACQVVGEAGRSGNAGGAHLHMEARLGPPGARFDSLAFYIVSASDVERENYLLWRTSGNFQHFDPMRLFIPPAQ